MSSANSQQVSAKHPNSLDDFQHQNPQNMETFQKGVLYIVMLVMFFVSLMKSENACEEEAAVFCLQSLVQ